MNPIRRIRRIAGVLAGLAFAWLGITVAAPAAFAAGTVPPPVGGQTSITVPHEPPGWYKHPPLPLGHVTGPVYQVHTVVVAGGMPGWQIALIALGAALAAATVAVLADRAWTARRKPTAAAA
jgi:hypothetical protein